jgi:hypothetical protein
VLVVDSGFEHDQWTMRGLQDGALRLQASIWEARKTRHVDCWRMVKDGEGWWRMVKVLQPSSAIFSLELQLILRACKGWWWCRADRVATHSVWAANSNDNEMPVCDTSLAFKIMKNFRVPLRH